jgi:hypothetical protein
MLFVFVSVRQDHYVAQTGLELVILLLLPPEYQDYKHASSCPATLFDKTVFFEHIFCRFFSSISKVVRFDEG